MKLLKGKQFKLALMSLVQLLLGCILMFTRPTSIFKVLDKGFGDVAVFGCVIIHYFDTVLGIEDRSKLHFVLWNRLLFSLLRMLGIASTDPS